MPEPKPDQADILAQNAQLNAEIETAQQSVAALTQERDSLKAENETLKTASDSLKAENATLKASQADFDKAVAKKVSELGISPTAIEGNPAKPSATREELATQLSEIKDPAERTNFWREHRAALIQRGAQ